MKAEIAKILKEAAKKLGMQGEPNIEYPENPEHGDFSTNIALTNAKNLGTNPRALAERVVGEIQAAMKDAHGDENAGGAGHLIEDTSIAGPGFINFKINPIRFAEEAAKLGANVGANVGAADTAGMSNSADKGKVMIEYTDPNTFKVFHIGHLMSNSIGESISRLIESSGKKVVRLCYPSDIGLHIAKSIWAIQKHASEIPAEDAPIAERTEFLGKMYVEGTKAYEADQSAKDDIDALNKVVYEKSSPAVNELYEKGRRWSLAHFDELYMTLGTKFDGIIYESEMAPVGLEIVKENTKPNGKRVFEESEGAVVFKGEEAGLHTRVFINSQGLPTYEAKEVGLNITKFKQHPDAEQSIIVTASEQNDYFKVLSKVIALLDPKDGGKMKHIGHGMMRFASGKMSSRTGNVITAEALIKEVKDMVRAKFEGRELSVDEAESIACAVAVGAIKYTILRSSPGSDIIFDSSASISFEGDSGPYLQYSAVRAQSVLEKAGKEGVAGAADSSGPAGSAVKLPEKVGLLERLLLRFPDAVERARNDLAPQHVAGYLISLASAFNSFYAGQVIVDKDDPHSPYYISITRAFRKVMEEGLWMLGISVPPKM